MKKVKIISISIRSESSLNVIQDEVNEFKKLLKTDEGVEIVWLQSAAATSSLGDGRIGEIPGGNFYFERLTAIIYYPENLINENAQA